MRQMMVGIFVLGIFINLFAFMYVLLSLNRSELRGRRGDVGPRGPIGERGETGDPGPIARVRGPKGDKGPRGPMGLPIWENPDS